MISVNTEMDESPVVRWFGPKFDELHPVLQDLHRRGGGRLVGPVDIGLGDGLAGRAGSRLGQRMGLPAAGPAQLEVDIGHRGGKLLWSRRFQRPGQAAHSMQSVFRPVGQWPTGHWHETTGPLQLALTVDIREGGWYWRPLSARLHGVPLPLRLLPRSHAFKRIEGDAYRFEVRFEAPLLGPLLWYGGLLRPQVGST